MPRVAFSRHPWHNFRSSFSQSEQKLNEAGALGISLDPDVPIFHAGDQMRQVRQVRLTTKPILVGSLAAALLVILNAWPVLAQSEHLTQAEIDSAIEESLWTLGPFRMRPQIRIGAGYDSNSLSSASATEQIDDFAARIAPGIRVVTPLKNHALLEVYEEVNFVYYNQVAGLRDIFNVTRLGGAVGGRKILFRVYDEFRNGKTRPSSEFDIPADRRQNTLLAEMDLSLGTRHLLTLGYRHNRLQYQDVFASPLRSTELLNRTEHSYALRFTRHLSSKTSAVIEGSYQLMDFDEAASLRDGQAYRAEGGFEFRPQSNVSGQALIGYKHMVPKFVLQPEYSGLVGSVDVLTQMGERFDVRTIYSRDTFPSVVAGNWYFIEHRFGGEVDVWVTRSFYFTPGVIIGRNNYPRPTEIINNEGELVEQAIEDRFDIYSLSINHSIGGFWRAYVSADYLDRQSNFFLFTKNRLVFGFGVSTDFPTR